MQTNSPLSLPSTPYCFSQLESWYNLFSIQLSISTKSVGIQFTAPPPCLRRRRRLLGPPRPAPPPSWAAPPGPARGSGREAGERLRHAAGWPRRLGEDGRTGGRTGGRPAGGHPAAQARSAPRSGALPAAGMPGRRGGRPRPAAVVESSVLPQ